MPAPYQTIHVRPISGGLNDEVNPVLIGDGQASDVQNVRFDRRSVKDAPGHTKINRDKPVSAGLRLRPPTGNQSMSAADGVPPIGGYVAVPYNLDQVPKTGEAYQIDVSFRINGPGLDCSASGEVGKFVPLVMRGGSNIERREWALGYAVGRPQGVNQGGANQDEAEPTVMRPSFEYLDVTNGNTLRFCSLDKELFPGTDYHLSLQFHPTDRKETKWFLNGEETNISGWSAGSARTAIMDPDPDGDADVDFGEYRDFDRLPTSNELAALDGKAALYFLKVGDHTIGQTPTTVESNTAASWPGTADAVYAQQGAYNGLKGLKQGGTSTTYAIVKHDGLSLTGPGGDIVDPADSDHAGVNGPTDTAYHGWKNYYVVSTSGTAGNLNVVRRVSALVADSPGWKVATTLLPATPGATDERSLLPKWQHVYHDTTIGEIRMWRGVTPNDAFMDHLVGKEVYEQRTDDAPFNRIAGAPNATATLQSLVGYWPCNDDGGVVIHDLGPYRNHGYLVPGTIAHDKEHDALFLDGTASAAYVDIDNENIARDLEDGLGKTGNYRVMFRTRLQFGRASVNPDPLGAAAAVPDFEAPYQTIWSWDKEDASGTYRPVLELRLINNRGGSASTRNKFVFAWSDKPDRTIYALFPTLDDLQIGEEFLLYAGIDDFGGTPKAYILAAGGADGTRTQERTALQATWVDSAGSSVTPAPEVFDAEKTRVTYGASVVPHPSTGIGEGATYPGEGKHQFLMGRIREAGFNVASMETYDPAASDINLLLHFGRLGEEEIFATLGSDARVANVTEGSTSVTPASGSSFDTDLKTATGWPLVFGDDTFIERDENKEEREVQRLRLATAHTSSAITLSRKWDEKTRSGVSIRVPRMLAHTLFEPTGKTTVVPGIVSGSSFAKTEDAFRSYGPMGLKFGVAMVPRRDGIPQEHFLPEWADGMTKAGRPRIDGLYQYKKTDGTRALMAASRGSLFEVDDRWRLDHPFAPTYSNSIQFRTITKEEAAKRDEISSETISAITDPVADDAIEVRPDVSDPRSLSFAQGDKTYQVETWIKLDSIAGSRTISCMARRHENASADLLNGTEVVNHQFGVRDGTPFFYTSDVISTALQESLWFPQSTDFGTKEASRRLVRAGEWTHLVFHVDAGASTWTSLKVAVNGRWFTMTEDESITGLTPNELDVPATGRALLVGSFGSTRTRPIGFRECLGGRMAGFRLADCTAGNYLYASTADFTPTAILSSDYEGAGGEPIILAGLEMSEGEDAALEIHQFVSGGEDPLAQFYGRAMIPVARGLGHLRRSEGDLPYSFAVFNETLFGTNGKTRPFRYDGTSTTIAGVEVPAHAPEISQTATPIHLPDEGADTVITQNDASTTDGGRLGETTVNKLDITAGAIQGGFRFTEDMVGWIVSIPSQKDQAGAEREYLGTIDSVTSSTAVLVKPDPSGTDQVSDDAQFDLAFQLFPASVANAGAGTSSTADVEAAIDELNSTTAYSAQRLKSVHSASDSPRAGGANDACAQFSGKHVLQVSSSSVFDVSKDKVLDFQAYVKFSDLSTNGDEAITMVERRANKGTGSYVMEVFDGGKFRFKFYDQSVGDFRSIESTGRIFSEDEWYWFRFRYQFKDAGKSVFDSSGGWQYDTRWWYHDNGDNTPRESFYRDGLWCYSVEGKSPADPFLVVPGCQSYFNVNDDQVHRGGEPGNCGALLANPYITPERGSPHATSATAISSIDVDVDDVGRDANTSTQPGSATKVKFHGIDLDSGTSTFDWLRWMSRFRHKNPTAAGAGATLGPSEASATLLDFTGPDRTFCARNSATDGRALMVKFISGNNVGRILAIEDIGVTPTTGAANGDLSSADIEGGDYLVLSDDKRLGADGKSTNLNASGAHEIVVYWPNGVEVPAFDSMSPDQKADATLIGHSASSTGNQTAMPTLLVQGTNPVGVNDHPAPSTAPLNMFGSELVGLSGGAIKGFKGTFEDVALKITDLHESNATVTTDQMAEQTYWVGPTDTRLYSAPSLDTAAIASARDGTAGRATVTFQMDELSGSEVAKSDTASQKSATAAPSGTIKVVDDTVQPPGKHAFRITYFDADQGVESNPSEDVFIQGGGELGTDEVVSAENPFVLKNLPISPDRDRNIHRRIYKTLSDGGTYFLAQTISDNVTREVGLEPSQTTLAFQKALEFDNEAAPISNFLAASENSMYYGGIVAAPQTVRFSKTEFPEQVPGVNEIFTESPEGNPVTALAVHFGDIIIFKRDSIFRSTQATGATLLERIESSIGATSHLSVVPIENTLYFLSEKGLYAWTGGRKVRYLGQAIENLYQGQHHPHMLRASAAFVRSSNEYVFTLQDVSTRPYANKVVTAEFMEGTPAQQHVFSVIQELQGADLMAMMDDELTDKPIPIIGTPGGFVSRWRDGDLRMMRNNKALYGNITANVNGSVVAGSGAVNIDSTAVLDTLKDGLGDVPILLVDDAATDDTVRASGVVFETESTTKVSVTYPADVDGVLDDDRMFVGGYEVFWASKWFDGGSPEKRKRWRFLDMTFSRKTDENVFVDVFTDFDDSTVQLTEKVAMTNGFYTIHLDGIRANFLKIRMRRAGDGPEIDIQDMTIRAEVVDAQ